MLHRPIRNTALAAALLVLAALTLSPAASAQGGVTTIDADHGLVDDASIQTFEEEGLVADSLLAPDLRLSIGQRYDDSTGTLRGRPNYSPPFVYLRVQYNETLPRTVRFHVPADYWYPYPADVQAENGEVEAQLRPSPNATHTVVTMHLDGQTDAVYQITLTASKTYVARDLSRSAWENATGVTVPRLGSAEEWNYINKSELIGDNTTVAIATGDERHVIQYDAAAGEGNRWLSVPECGASLGDEAPVCQFERPGDQDRVYVLTRERFDMQDNPPPVVRYKLNAGVSDSVSIGGIVDGIVVTVQRAVDAITGIFS